MNLPDNGTVIQEKNIMLTTHTLGFPRIGIQRELKKAQERFWQGQCSESELLQTAHELRRRHWTLQREAGIDLIPVGDFSLYDHMLDTACLFNLIPERFANAEPSLDRYFYMARGDAQYNIHPMEMTKWFDTNYHYIVPEFSPSIQLQLNPEPLLAQLQEAKNHALRAKAVLTGPFTLLKLGKCSDNEFSRWKLVPQLATLYASLIHQIAPHCEWIQIDEPALALDLPPEEQTTCALLYEQISSACELEKVMLATYFGAVDHHLELIRNLPTGALHIDLVSAPEQLEAFCRALPPERILSLGLINGRNIWRAEYEPLLKTIAAATENGREIWLGTSCSLLHVPIDLEPETALPSAIKSWMAFARQKCRELVELSSIAQGGSAERLDENRTLWQQRRSSSLVHDPAVQARLQNITPDMAQRTQPYLRRATLQREKIPLPALPTTTIGSFPQTPELRRIRLQFKRGEISALQYEKYIRSCIREAVEIQEELGLDVLVHGEPERNDMVEYFGQQLNGYCFTQNGWVQSYGSRCVKPPIIYGDVSRPKPMTTEWARYAQSLTTRPMKGMLTGPVTMLCWSFERDDQPRAQTCRQIALAIRDEVLDLEKAGIPIIQIDEAAFREGLPLRRAQWNDYLQWAVDCFHLTSCGVQDHIQIHTHMCYSEFNDIIEWIARMDADVISIEASRSRMEILDAFTRFNYPNEIGPGVYDIHSPRIPSTAEMITLIQTALSWIPARQLWVNPDCGLKTRAWPESKASLRNMVEAAKTVRQSLCSHPAPDKP
jgi:5-methyltetrahydropteroyltriglutamate--homocysteine methyltransferase